MGRMAKAERAEKMTQALELSAKGKSYTAIGKELEVAWRTAKALVEDELARRGEHRQGEAEKAIATYEAIISEGWARLEKLKDSRSYNVSGLLNSIKGAQDSINRITGAEQPIRYKDETEEAYTIVFDEDEIALEGD